MGKPREKRKKTQRPAAAAEAGQPRRGWPRRLLAWAFKASLKWGTVAAVWAVIGFLGLAAWYGTDLPDVDQAFDATRRPTVTLVAVDGTPLLTVGDVYGVAARLAALPPALPKAVLATEDRRFYRHVGLDPIGLARAMVANLRAGRIVQGGSTITQQVAKNLFLTPERTLKRKIQEVMLALWLEHRFTKDQILTIYLNRVYLGHGTYGVDAAARKYFGRPATALTTFEAATLAGLLKAPSRLNPLANPDGAKARAGQVLNNMVAAGYLTPADAERAKAGARPTAPVEAAGAGRHFADWVIEQVGDFVNPGDRDLVVFTTLDPRLQRAASARVAATLKNRGRRDGIAEAALLAVTPWGAVRAMVGGRSYAESQFNRATQARRQPGSAFKPFVYLAGLEAGLGPDTEVVDEPVSFGAWSPHNFSGRYEGAMRLEDALARSVNTVAVRVAEKAGRRNVIRVARRLGFSGDMRPTPALALGAEEVTLLELTQAYAAFANGGAGVWAYGIEEIRDKQGRALYRRRGSGPGRVIDAADAAAMNRMLARVIEQGTGRAAAIGRPAAGKTGTSQNFRDAWFIGFTADLVTGVWMGNDDDRPTKGVTGGGAPARLWRDFMAAAHQGVPARPLPGLEREIPAAAPAARAPVDNPGFWGNFFGNVSGKPG